MVGVYQITAYGQNIAILKSVKNSFIISGPGVKKGSITENYMELIDLYPTICDLIAIDKPQKLTATLFGNAK